MANVVYANPFGAYTEGQSRGLEDAVRAGEASRRFRDSDVNADFMKWYAPLRRQEAQTDVNKNTLALNEGLLQNAGRLTAFGEGGRQYFNNTLQNMYGPDVRAEAKDPVQFQRVAGEGAGLTPYGVYDPMFAGVGHYGYTKRENLSPQEFEQQMQLRHGPNWQTQAGQQATPSFNAFDTATSHIFPGANSTPAPAAAGNAPMSSEEQQFQKTMGEVNNPYNPESPLYNSGQQASRPTMQQPRSIWADEYKPAGSGGISAPGSTNPRVNNATGIY